MLAQRTTIRAISIVLLAFVPSTALGQQRSSSARLVRSGQSSATPSPTQVVIVNAWDDDYYPYWQATITEAAERPDGVLVTYTYVESATQPCNQPDIKSTSRFLPSTKIKTLTTPLNMCALDARKINSAANRFTRRPKPYETLRTGILASCGTSKKLFELPEFKMNTKVLSRKSPHALMLTKLEYNVLHAAFGTEELDHLVSQQLGAERVVDLKSERFRPAFWFCFRGAPPGLPARIEESPNPTFREDCDWLKLQNVLAAYKHPAGGFSGREARLIDSGGYRLLKYVAAQYPRIALQARVQGKMELELNVNQKTGYVESVSVSGQPLLLRAAREAAKQWQFDPTQAIQNPAKATLDFSFECSESPEDPSRAK